MAHVPRSPTEAHIEAFIEEEVKSRVPEALAEMMGENVEDMRAQARREESATPVAEYFPWNPCRSGRWSGWGDRGPSGARRRYFSLSGNLFTTMLGTSSSSVSQNATRPSGPKA